MAEQYFNNLGSLRQYFLLSWLLLRVRKVMACDPRDLLLRILGSWEWAASLSPKCSIINVINFSNQQVKLIIGQVLFGLKLQLKAFC